MQNFLRPAITKRTFTLASKYIETLFDTSSKLDYTSSVNIESDRQVFCNFFDCLFSVVPSSGSIDQSLGSPTWGLSNVPAGRTSKPEFTFRVAVLKCEVLCLEICKDDLLDISASLNSDSGRLLSLQLYDCS